MITTAISAEGLISQLADEIVDSYETSDSTVTAIVTALLAFQRLSPPITVGTIEPTVSRALTVENETILWGLVQLHDSVGGYIYVDNDRQLNWLNDIGEDKGQQIRYRKNLTGITREIDWGELCTRLFPTSGSTKLSDLTVIREEVDKASDASYGYLTLPDTDKYACYKDWTGLGNALPSHIFIYEKDSIVWVSPDWFIDIDSLWVGETLAFDEDTGTFTYDYVAAGAWSAPLELTNGGGVGEIGAIGLRVMLTNISALGVDVQIWVTADTTYGEEDWDLVVNTSLSDADNDVWKEYTFSARKVWKAKLKIKNKSGSSAYIRIKEFDWKTELEVTSDFHQGADERTFRCAIGDYNPAATYVVYYQRADYLMAWDVVGTYGQFSRVRASQDVDNASALLDAARLLLDEAKTPKVTYAVFAIDLSDFTGFEFEELQLGSMVNVIDEELDIVIQTRVIKISHPDLFNPHKMMLELSNKVRDITDTLSDMHRIFG